MTIYELRNKFKIIDRVFKFYYSLFYKYYSNQYIKNYNKECKTVQFIEIKFKNGWSTGFLEEMDSYIVIKFNDNTWISKKFRFNPYPSKIEKIDAVIEMLQERKQNIK